MNMNRHYVNLSCTISITVKITNVFDEYFISIEVSSKVSSNSMLQLLTSWRAIALLTHPIQHFNQTVVKMKALTNCTAVFPQHATHTHIYNKSMWALLKFAPNNQLHIPA